MAVIEAGQCLGDWIGELNRGGSVSCVDGYFTTRGGKILDSQVLAKELGLGPEQEVVLQGRLRGGGGVWRRGKGCTRRWY